MYPMHRHMLLPYRVSIQDSINGYGFSGNAQLSLKLWVYRATRCRLLIEFAADLHSYRKSSGRMPWGCFPKSPFTGQEAKKGSQSFLFIQHLIPQRFYGLGLSPVCLGVFYEQHRQPGYGAAPLVNRLFGLRVFALQADIPGTAMRLIILYRFTV